MVLEDFAEHAHHALLLVVWRVTLELVLEGSEVIDLPAVEIGQLYLLQGVLYDLLEHIPCSVSIPGEDVDEGVVVEVLMEVGGEGIEAGLHSLKELLQVHLLEVTLENPISLSYRTHHPVELPRLQELVLAPVELMLVRRTTLLADGGWLEAGWVAAELVDNAVVGVAEGEQLFLLH